MSLLNKASIITTPTAYAEDYLYSIKPAYATNEVVVNGTFDTDTDWAKSAGATISNGKATIVVTGGGFEFLQQSISYDLGAKYKVKLTVQGLSGSSGKAIRFQDDASNLGTLFQIKTLDETVQTFEAEWTPNSQSDVIQISRSTASGDYSFTVDNVSVKKIENADFDFDRNSTGTRVNEDYLIEDVPYNFVTYSEDFTQWTIQSGTTVTSNTTETLSPSGEYNASKIVGNGTSGIFNSGLSSIGGTNTKSIYIKGTEAGQVVYLKDPNQTVNNKVLTLTTEWQRYTLTESQTSDFGIWIDDIPTSGIYMWGAQVVKGDQAKDYLKTTDRLDIPRIDYTNGEPSILLEPSSTNYVSDSNNQNDSWLKSNVTFTENTVTSPDGTQNASTLDFSAINGLFRFITASGNPDTKTFTASVYLKAGTATSAKIIILGSGGGLGLVSEDVTLTNDWQRFSVTSSFSGTGDNVRIRVQSLEVGTMYFFGGQVEELSYATSLIPTSGSTVTRSADVANNAGNSDLINSTEGVLYAEISALADDLSSRIISLSDGTDTNRVNLFYFSQSNDLAVNYRVSGSTVVSFIADLTDITNFSKVAFKWESGNFKMYVDGTLIDEDTNTTMLPSDTLDVLSFSRGDGSFGFYGNTKMVAVFKEALSDTELECLTGYNNHELYMNYYNRLSYLGLVEEYNVESDINNYIL